MSRVEQLIVRTARRILTRNGLRVVEASKAPEVRHVDVWDAVRRFTMVDSARVDALFDAVRQIVKNDVPGDLVECGVYRGGCSMTMALALNSLGVVDRSIWLYDTFSGMTRPGALDIRLHDGQDAIEPFEAAATGPNSSTWCEADLDSVKQNMRTTGYPPERMRFIAGPVEETLHREIPEQISLLRLDTDWYESTRVELEVLLPRLSPGGVLIIDDYNHWSGARRAVDEYLSANNLRLVLFPVGKGSVMTTIGSL